MDRILGKQFEGAALDVDPSGPVFLIQATGGEVVPGIHVAISAD